MNVLDRNKIKMDKAKQGFDCHEMQMILESKLSLINHALLYGTEELTSDNFYGLSYLVCDIEAGLAKVLKFAQAAESYLYYLNKPEAVEEDKRMREMFKK